MNDNQQYDYRARLLPSSRPVIVQSNQLYGDKETGEWKETINEQEKDEQQRLQDIRSLHFNSLAHLQNCFEFGTVLLDVDESDYQKLFPRIAEQMVSDGLIGESIIGDLLKVLLLKEHPGSETDLRLQEQEPISDQVRLDTEMIDINKTRSDENISSKLTRKLKSSDVFPEAAIVMVGSVNFLQKTTIAFVRLKTAAEFTELTKYEYPIRFVFIFLGPERESLNYFEIGRCICAILSDKNFGLEAYEALSKEDLAKAIEGFFMNTQVVPPISGGMTYLTELIKGNTSEECQYNFGSKKQTLEEAGNNLINGKICDRKSRMHPLEKTNRLWGGLINDIKRRIPEYKSDIVDGLNKETVAASIFLFFGVLSTVITFGGLMSVKTQNLMGISETLLSTSIVGIVFHLFSSQPLIIVGGTGPLLLFDEALFQFCEANHFDFLTVRIYIGLWLGLIAIAIAAFDGCVYLRLFTRFTQELFASLISLIFMMEALFKIIDVYKIHPVLVEYSNQIGHNITSLHEINVDQYKNITMELPSNQGVMNQPNTALFCTILSIGTFSMAYCLRVFRNSHFLSRKIRRAIGDFGIPIAIATFVCLSYNVPQVYTDKLIVPKGISPTDPNQRGWLIPFNAVPKLVPFAAFVAALLVYVLIFMETQISELILDKPERGLKKGSGFHLDIVIICVMNAVCGFLGMPWQSGATVRLVTHVSAVTVLSQSHVLGDKSQVLRVNEQRVSGFVISLMVGLSATMTPLLKIIPMSVLYGVFFYMGISSISGAQFLHRIRLIFTPTKYHGNQVYVTRVQTWKMHTFTFVQVFALCLLWIVKSSKYSLALPFVLVLMLPLRQKMCSYFSPKEIAALDGNLPEVDVNDEPDFYYQSHLAA